jgi:hypothetical protein
MFIFSDFERAKDNLIGDMKYYLKVTQADLDVIRKITDANDLDMYIANDFTSPYGEVQFYYVHEGEEICL